MFALTIDTDSFRAAEFSDLVRRYQEYGYTIARAIVTEHADAEDVVQTAWLRTLQTRQASVRYDLQHNFTAWFGRIVRNAAIDCVRRRMVRIRHFGDVERRVPDGAGTHEMLFVSALSRCDPAEASELRDRLVQALRTLPVRMRSIVVLHDVHGLTHVELGHLFACPPATSRSDLFHGRRRLRALLSDLVENADLQRICA